MSVPSLSIVLIPGFMLNESLWDDMLQYFPKNWKIHNASLEHGHTMEEIADDIVKNLPKEFILIGFSLGGYIARFITDQFPERVSALILISSSLRDDTEEQKKQKLSVITTSSKRTFKGLSHISIARTLHASQSKNDFLIQRIKKMGEEMGYEVFVSLSLLKRNINHKHTVKCPTFIIHGAQDLLRSKEEAIELFSLIPQSDLEIIEHSGHMIPLEQPYKLTTSIVNWLRVYLSD